MSCVIDAFYTTKVRNDTVGLGWLESESCSYKEEVGRGRCFVTGVITFLGVIVHRSDGGSSRTQKAQLV